MVTTATVVEGVVRSEGGSKRESGDCHSVILIGWHVCSGFVEEAYPVMVSVFSMYTGFLDRK